MHEKINSRVHDYYWNEDFSCVVTTLKVLSELFYPRLHPQVIDAAVGLNAGRFRSQCGLVQGTLLFIGSYGCQQNIKQEQIITLCRQFGIEFQEHFGSLLCNQLRPQGFRPDNPPHLCEKLTKQAIAFSAKFILEKINPMTKLQMGN